MDPEWAREERVPLRRMLTLADLFTLLNGFFGLAAILMAALDQVRFAFMLILLGILLDGVDGGLTRIGYGGGRLGGKLDSLSDLVTFCVAPAVLFWTAMRSQPLLPGLDLPQAATAGIVLGASVFYFLAGLLRLARFDYLKGGERHDYFIGVTTPGGAVVAASLSLLGWDLTPSLVLLVVTGLLMTSRVRLPKLRDALAIPTLLVLSAAVLLVAFNEQVPPVILLVCFLFYLLLGPGYVRRHAEDEEALVTQ